MRGRHLRFDDTSRRHRYSLQEAACSYRQCKKRFTAGDLGDIRSPPRLERQVPIYGQMRKVQQVVCLQGLQGNCLRFFQSKRQCQLPCRGPPVFSAARAHLRKVGAMARWIVDPDHTVAAFSIVHMMIAHVHGQFNKISGTVYYDPLNINSSSVELVIDVASIYTGIRKRDDHGRISALPPAHSQVTGRGAVRLRRQPQPSYPPALRPDPPASSATGARAQGLTGLAAMQGRESPDGGSHPLFFRVSAGEDFMIIDRRSFLFYRTRCEDGPRRICPPARYIPMDAPVPAAEAGGGSSRSAAEACCDGVCGGEWPPSRGAEGLRGIPYWSRAMITPAGRRAPRVPSSRATRA